MLILGPVGVFNSIPKVTLLGCETRMSGTLGNPSGLSLEAKTKKEPAERSKTASFSRINQQQVVMSGTSRQLVLCGYQIMLD